MQTPDALAQAVAGANTVYHCAARVGYWGTRREFQTDIVDATRNVAQACRTAGVGRLLHVSSVLVYGYRPRVPPEGLCEDHALGPGLSIWNHYGRSKMQAEEIVRAEFADTTIVRPTWDLASAR